MSNTVRRERFQGPIAILADIAANLEALDAVIAGCRHAGAATFFVGGGLCDRGSQPLEVWQRLQEIGAQCTRGVSELAMSSIEPSNLRPTDASQRAALERFKANRAALGELILLRMKKLPDVLRVELEDGAELAVMYGSPRDPLTPIEHDLTDEELYDLVHDDSADVIVSGGAGVSFVRALDGVTVVGAGSVGAVAQATGERKAAHFVLVAPTSAGLRVEPRWVHW
jgi:hypothetical protein